MVLSLSVINTATLSSANLRNPSAGSRKQEGALQAEVSFSMRATISLDLEKERKELLDALIDADQGASIRAVQE